MEQDKNKFILVFAVVGMLAFFASYYRTKYLVANKELKEYKEKEDPSNYDDPPEPDDEE